VIMETVVAILNPFPGLRAFEEEEDILFFGREKQVDELLRKLRMSRFLAIIGSSGSGKSSLVKSGLLPSLHSGLMSGVGSQWRIALFRPGNDPIGQLNLALSKNGVLRDDQSPDDLEINTAINEAILRRSNLGLIEAYSQSRLDKKNNLLVLVDQFEEIFRFSKYEKEEGDGKRDSIAFINLLLKAAEQKEFPIYVVFTMRSDFLGDCTEFRGLPEAINEGQYLVPRMTREERRDAIAGPIAVGKGTITPALVNRFLNDVGDNPDQLPILQHAMMRTWDRWKAKARAGEPMDIDDYEAIGTISEALSQHAEEAYAELASDKERQICETIFKELTDKGGLANGIRRPRLLSELCAASGAARDEVKKVIEIFRKPGRGFLMPAYSTPITEHSIIDISHESIMRVWKRLITWLEEEEEAAQMYLHLCESVHLYESGKGGLLRDPELQMALKWREAQNKNAAWASRYNDYFDKVIFFLEHSRQKRELEIQHKEELQKQRLRISRRITMAAAVVALLALIAGIIFFELRVEANKAKNVAIEQKKEADKQRLQAEANKLAALSAEKRAEMAKDSATVSKERAVAEERIALHNDSIAHRETGKARFAESLALHAEDSAKRSAERAMISESRATKSADEAVASKKSADAAKERAEILRMVAVSKNDANRAIRLGSDTATQNQCLGLALLAYKSYHANHGDVQDNDIYNALYLSWQNATNYVAFNNHGAPIRAMAPMPEKDVIFSGDENGHLTTFHTIEGKIQSQKNAIRTGGEIRFLVVDPGGNYLLAVLFKGAAILYKIGENEKLSEISRVRFSGIGKHGCFLDNKYFLVQTTEGVSRFDLNNPSMNADSIKIPNCSAIAVGNNGKIFISTDYAINEYNSWGAVKTKSSDVFTLSNHITAICLDKSGRYLAAGTYAGGVWMKDLNNRHAAASYQGIHKSAVNDLKFCSVPDNYLQLASASSDGAVKLTEVSADTLKFNNAISVTDHGRWVYALVYSYTRRFVFSGGEDAEIYGSPTTMSYIYNVLSK